MKRGAVSFAVLLMCVSTVSAQYSCGGYTSVSAIGETATITSPGFPSNYSNSQNCIWVIEVPTTMQAYVQLKISNFSVPSWVAISQMANVSDALTVREGNVSAPLLLLANYKNPIASGTTVSTVSRIMWIRFNSDFVDTSTGFSATWTAMQNTFVLSDNIIQTCPTYDYWCPNKQCVSYAYMCDGYVDCGVDGNNDESSLNCLSLPLSTSQNAGIFLGVPIAVGFIVIAILVGVTAEQQMQIIKNQQAQLKMQEDEREEEKLMMSLSGKAAASQSGGEIVIISTSQRDVSADNPRAARRGILRRPGEKKKVKLKARFNV